MNLSRSLGDFEYKMDKGIPPEGQIITANPDVRVIDRTEDDLFILMGCDGI